MTDKKGRDISEMNRYYRKVPRDTKDTFHLSWTLPNEEWEWEMGQKDITHLLPSLTSHFSLRGWSHLFLIISFSFVEIS